MDTLETQGFGFEADGWKDKRGRIIKLNSIPRALFRLPDGREVELLADSYNLKRYLSKGFILVKQ